MEFKYLSRRGFSPIDDQISFVHLESLNDEYARDIIRFRINGMHVYIQRYPVYTVLFIGMTAHQIEQGQCGIICVIANEL